MGTDLFHADGQTHRRADRETDRQTDMKKLMVVFVIMGTRLKTPEICDVLFRIQSSVFMVFRGSLPLLSPAFRRSHVCRQVPPRPQRRERS